MSKIIIGCKLVRRRTSPINNPSSPFMCETNNLKLRLNGCQQNWNLFNPQRINILKVVDLNEQRVMLWSCLVMIIPMLPSSNLFFPVGFVIAERILYLPRYFSCH